MVIILEGRYRNYEDFSRFLSDDADKINAE
jgi:hypothetical protein